MQFMAVLYFRDMAQARKQWTDELPIEPRFN